MPKRPRSELDGDRTEEPLPQQLYLIFDDWSRGYSIREVNLPSGSSHLSAVSGEVDEQRLPPPFFCLAAPRRLPSYFASAFGTSIVATHPKDSRCVGASESAVPIFDVRKRSMIFGPPQGFAVCPIYFPVGADRLFSLDCNSMELLCRSPKEQPAHYSYDEDLVEWAWCELPDAPFQRMDVTSYAVHPHGPTILFSIKSDATKATFAFDTSKFVWKQHSDWALPFTGRAHFDPDLKAFVGLSDDPETLGHLCSCPFDKKSLDGSKTQCPAPAWKLCKEKMFSQNPGERHVSAALMYVGSDSRFCLVECLFFEDVRADQVLEEEGDVRSDQVLEEVPRRRRRRRSCYMYRLTTFSLRFGSKQKLRTKDQLVRYCKVPKKTTMEFLRGGDPVAFLL